MTIWQADLYRRPLRSPEGDPLWELLLCDRSFNFTFGATAPQPQINAAWVTAQLRQALQQAPEPPTQIQVFRPASLSLLEVGATPLGLSVVPERHTSTLHRWLDQRARWYPTLDTYSGDPYAPLALDHPPPTPLPETLWGDRWGFTALSAEDFERSLPHEPIPIRHLPPERLPLAQGLASPTPLPGIVIDGGRQAMALGRWLQSVRPAWVAYQRGELQGLVLEAGLVDRWILTTFSDEAMAAAGAQFEARKQASRGLHWLLVRPDDSGMTHTGLWLLQQPLG